MDHDQNEYKSKSQLKREAEALQDLGTTLAELPDSQFAAMPLPPELREAVALARRLDAREGRRRQLQYIGRLMRDIDAAPIRAALEKLERGQRQDAAHFQELERWRDRLVTGGDAEIEELLALRPQADRQRLRQLQRNARAEAAASKPPKSARELFRYLRELAE